MAEGLTVRYSPVEVLRTRDIAVCGPEELEEAHRLMRDIDVYRARRRARRRKPSRDRRDRLDVRRTVRHALRHGGEPIRRLQTRPGERVRRLVLLLYVSGSMDPYVRALLRFAQTAVAWGRSVEAFALGTRLTRLTRELAGRDPDAALSAVAGAVPDWAGGTRLGEALRVFNDSWGIRGMAREATVVVLSDGWDRGSPELLGAEMARLSRVADRIVWVNPLKATPGYEPLAAGMASALPYVDDFVSGHSLEAIEELAALLGRARLPDRTSGRNTASVAVDGR